MTVASCASPDAILMRFQQPTPRTKVLRATLTTLATQLGYEFESEVLHCAVHKLADEVLPAYEQVGRALTAKQMTAIRKATAPAGLGKLISSLF